MNTILAMLFVLGCITNVINVILSEKANEMNRKILEIQSQRIDVLSDLLKILLEER